MIKCASECGKLLSKTILHTLSENGSPLMCRQVTDILKSTFKYKNAQLSVSIVAFYLSKLRREGLVDYKNECWYVI